MNDEARTERNQEKDLVPRQSPDSTDSVQGELWPISELLQLERKRVDSQNRRTEVAHRAIEASDAADQRQYDYHVEKLRRDDEARRRRHETIGTGLGGFGIVWFFWNRIRRLLAHR